MAKTITVTGIGHASVKPDQVELLFSLEVVGKNYDKVMAQTAERYSKIAASLERAGFRNDLLKTIYFNVQTLGESIPEDQRDYLCAFKGYKCIHKMRMVFAFHTSILSDALKAIINSKANPDIQILFTMKDPDAVNTQILTDAANNARKKAEILCLSSGAALGELMAIHDNRSAARLESKTTYNYDQNSIAAGSAAHYVEINPEDIAATYSAIFVWEIL